MQTFLDFWNHWKKKWKEVVSDLKTFAHKGSKIAAANSFFFRFVLLYLFTLFKPLFTPTSWSLMSKLFRFSESLGKINGKKLSQIWKVLLKNGIKSPRIYLFIFFFFQFCLTGRIIFVISATIRISREMLCLPYAGFFVLVLLYAHLKGSSSLP